ncbi:MAG: tRNA (guanine(10)-N(2))-dimethyltransferase [Candidatus Bathyarchaeia archaeon]
MRFSFPTETVAEGVVQVIVPRLQAFVKKPSDYAPSKAPVFYNPVMELNRDLAVLALQVFQRFVGRDLTVCEPLAGCGIRGIRFAKEVEGVKKVIVNDINSEACRLARFNVEKNEVIDKVDVKNNDANFLLSRFAAPRRRFDYVDVDPFGSPMPYVDSALRALRSGGLLALTATDLAPLCGIHPKACVRKYGGRPLRTEYCHELAVRLLAGGLVRSAAKYDVSVKVMFSHSSGHYIRLYAMVDYGAKKADESLKDIGYINHCFTCFHREVAPGIFHCKREKCPECGSEMSFAGPLWIGKIVHENFVASMEREARTKAFRQKKKIRRLLFLTKKEASAHITYYRVDKICDKFGLPVPSIRRVAEELEKAGYNVSLIHFKTQGIKTDASARTVKETIAKIC